MKTTQPTTLPAVPGLAVALNRGSQGRLVKGPAASLCALLFACCPSFADVVLQYDFTGDQPFIADRSGHLNHGLAFNAERVQDEGRPCIRLLEGGYVRLPEAALLLGTAPSRGALEFSVKPEFDPAALPTGTWDGWVTFIYFQRTSDNGLPDGYNELGLAQHGLTLMAKAAGGQEAGAFVWQESPLRQNQWTRLRLEWEPGRRALHVDGALAAERKGEFAAPELDMLPGYLGRHPASGKWGFVGLISNVKVEVGE